MHEALNQMGPLQDYGLQPNETKYVELRSGSRRAWQSPGLEDVCR